MNKLYIRKSNEKSVKKQFVINKTFIPSELDYAVNAILTSINSFSFEIDPIVDNETIIDNNVLEIFYPYDNKTLDLRFNLNDYGKFRVTSDVLAYIKSFYK